MNGTIIQPDGVCRGKAVIIEEDHIADIVDVGSVSNDLFRIDVDGRYITPGLIDIHTHGANNYTFNEPTHQAFESILSEYACHGITSVLATLVTAPISDLVGCLDFGSCWMSEQHPMTSVIGMHLEGPYISSEQRGAHNIQAIRIPSDGTVDRLLEYASVIRLFTYAPELSGGLELTSRLARLGIVPSAGHSSALSDDIVQAVKAGLRHVVHLWSGQSSTIRQGPWRRPGLLEASLTLEDLTAEIIADLKHLPPLLLTLALKCLGPDRLCVVSDASNGAGLSEGTRFALGDVPCEVYQGVGMILDHTSFAGSTTFLNEMLHTLVNEVHVNLVEAIRMATLTPARIIGIAERKGSLVTGKDADIVVFDEDFTPWLTLINGQCIYERVAL